MCVLPTKRESTMNDPTIITFNGQDPGQTVSIFAGTHGDEIGGVIALRKLIKDIEEGVLVIQRGQLHVAFANPAAIVLGKRFVELNLNRAFFPHLIGTEVPEHLRSSYERRRALELQILLDESDALLDLHSTTSEGTPFIICEPHSFDIARQFPFRFISSGWDTMHPGSSDGYMNQYHKIGICVECGQHFDQLTSVKARASIEIFLKAMGLIDETIYGPSQSSRRHIRIRAKYVVKRLFRLENTDWPDFPNIEPGTILGYDGGEAVIVNEPSILFFPKDEVKAGEEAFLLGEEVPI